MNVFAGDKGSENVTAFLDGIPVENAVMADDVLGVVEVYAVGEDGALLPDEPAILRHGNVEIKPGSLRDHGITSDVSWR